MTQDDEFKLPEIISFARKLSRILRQYFVSDDPNDVSEFALYRPASVMEELGPVNGLLDYLLGQGRKDTVARVYREFVGST